MADMGVISSEEARRRMRILYAVRASQIYGNLNHLDNDFVSYMVWYIMLWRRCKTSSDDFFCFGHKEILHLLCFSFNASWGPPTAPTAHATPLELLDEGMIYTGWSFLWLWVWKYLMSTMHCAICSSSCLLIRSCCNPMFSYLDAGEQAEKPKEDEDSNVDWVNWASLEKWLEIMGASDSLRRCKISLIN